AGCWELVNPWCSLVTLTAHLRQRSSVPTDATLTLLAEDGHLVSLGQGLEEGLSQSATGSSLLRKCETYVLVRILSKEGRVGFLPAISPYWRTWTTRVQSWQ
uniref:Uncharacterized protein n=1 Tax=Loxodonta africana TaxID=9785 RepID=G3TFP8_LOXAF